jgi:signal transduction histidine kinase
VTVVLCFHFTLVAAGMILRSNRRLMASLKDRAVQAEEGQRMRVEEARHLERERIAREMHDVLAHRISLLAVHAGALEFRPDASPQEKQAAGVIRESAHEALEDLRAVIGMLRTDERDAERPQPTLAGLPELIEESRRAGARVTVTGADTAQAPDRIGRHAYRIVQEGLTNARKHAPAAKVEVTLSTDQGELCLEVRNRLTVSSAPAIPGAGAGIIGLRERVALLGGRLEAGPTPDGDFRLTAWLPLPS